MPPNPKLWSEALEWMQTQASGLPKLWPAELPPEEQSESEEFWRQACRYEMSTRDVISAKIRALATRSSCPTFSPLESWLLWRRFEWAGQLILSKAMENTAPPASVSLPYVLEWALVTTWETDGCIGMWMHSERGGVAHPDNPDGMSPIP